MKPNNPIQQKTIGKCTTCGCAIQADDEHYAGLNKTVYCVKCKPNLPTWPRNVTINAKDVKDRIYCSNCGKRWEGDLLGSMDFSKAKFTRDAITVPTAPTQCSCKNPQLNYYVGTEDFITGDISLPIVRKENAEDGVKIV